jgi:hypothetical protein
MSDTAMVSGAARKVYKGTARDKMIPFLGVRIPKIRLSSLGASTISLPSPPRMLILMASYILLFWLMSGGIYFMVRNPIAVGSSGGQAVFFYPSMNESFVIEGVIAAIMLFMCGMGMIFLYQASLQKLNRSYATKLLMTGLILGLVSFLVLQWIIRIKLGQV